MATKAVWGTYRKEKLEKRWPAAIEFMESDTQVGKIVVKI